MDNKEEKKELPKPTEYQIGLKNGKFVPVIGFVKDEGEVFAFVGTDGRFYKFQKSGLAAIIRDLKEDESFEELKKKQKVMGYEMYLESGGTLGFNGWHIPDSENCFLSEKDDFIEIFDNIIYSSYGDPVEIKPKAAPKKKAPLKAVK